MTNNEVIGCGILLAAACLCLGAGFGGRYHRTQEEVLIHQRINEVLARLPEPSPGIDVSGQLAQEDRRARERSLDLAQLRLTGEVVAKLDRRLDVTETELRRCDTVMRLLHSRVSELEAKQQQVRIQQPLIQRRSPYEGVEAICP